MRYIVVYATLCGKTVVSAQKTDPCYFSRDRFGILFFRSKSSYSYNAVDSLDSVDVSSALNVEHCVSPVLLGLVYHVLDVCALICNSACYLCDKCRNVLMQYANECILADTLLRGARRCGKRKSAPSGADVSLCLILHCIFLLERLECHQC